MLFIISFYLFIFNFTLFICLFFLGFIAGVIYSISKSTPQRPNKQNSYLPMSASSHSIREANSANEMNHTNVSIEQKGSS